MEQETEFSTLYKLRSNLQPDNQLASFISIKTDTTLLVQGTEADNYEFGVAFKIGANSIASNYFKHNPPTPSETEEGIMVVEDEIMPYHKKLTPETTLYCADSDLETVLALAHPNAEQPKTLNRTDVEVLFGRLSAIIAGRPASMDILPTDNEFAARLLIIREVLHHLGFMQIEYIGRV